MNQFTVSKIIPYDYSYVNGFFAKSLIDKMIELLQKNEPDHHAGGFNFYP